MMEIYQFSGITLSGHVPCCVLIYVAFSNQLLSSIFTLSLIRLPRWNRPLIRPKRDLCRHLCKTLAHNNARPLFRLLYAWICLLSENGQTEHAIGQTNFDILLSPDPLQTNVQAFLCSNLNKIRITCSKVTSDETSVHLLFPLKLFSASNFSLFEGNMTCKSISGH